MCNIKIVDFLDVTFNLNNDSYEPHIKENASPIYVSTDSNHPRNIIKQIPKSIEDRLSRNSSCKNTFDKIKNVYEDALKKKVDMKEI